MLKRQKWVITALGSYNEYVGGSAILLELLHAYKYRISNPVKTVKTERCYACKTKLFCVFLSTNVC